MDELKKYPFGDKHSHVKSLLLRSFKFEMERANYQDAFFAFDNYLWLYPDDRDFVRKFIDIYSEIIIKLLREDKSEITEELNQTYLTSVTIPNDNIRNQMKKAFFSQFKKYAPLGRMDDAGFFLCSILEIDPEDFQIQKLLMNLIFSTIKHDKEDVLFLDFFILEIAKSIIMVAFSLNRKNNTFYASFNHFLGEGDLITASYGLDKKYLKKTGPSEETNEGVFTLNGDKFEIVVNSKTKTISIKSSERNTKYSYEDIALEDNNGVLVEPTERKDELIFDLSRYYEIFKEKIGHGDDVA